MKLAVLDFEKGELHIYDVTAEMCESEDLIRDYIDNKLHHNLEMCQYMYGEFDIKSDIIIE